MGGFRFYVVYRIRTRWRGAARLKVAGATECVDFKEIANYNSKFKIQNFFLCFN